MSPGMKLQERVKQSRASTPLPPVSEPPCKCIQRPARRATMNTESCGGSTTLLAESSTLQLPSHHPRDTTIQLNAYLAFKMTNQAMFSLVMGGI